MPKRTPVNEVLSLIKQGYTDADIIRYLRDENYSPRQINDAMNQAKIKLELAKTAEMEDEVAEEYSEEEPESGQEMQPSIMSRGEDEYSMPESMPETPTPEQVEMQAEVPSAESYPYPYPYAGTDTTSTEATEEIAEEIIREKWEEFIKKVGNISEFKTYIESRLKSNEDRMRRLERNFDRLQDSVLGKVQEYGGDVKNLGSEVQALEDAFKKILQPLAGSIKELQSLFDEMQKDKSTKKTATKLLKITKELKTKITKKETKKEAKFKKIKKTTKKKKK